MQYSCASLRFRTGSSRSMRNWRIRSLGERRARGGSGLRRQRRDVVARHQVVDQPMELVPRRFAEAVVAHDERRAGVELLVLQVAAGELRADQVPGQLVELHALERGELRGLPV